MLWKSLRLLPFAKSGRSGNRRTRKRRVQLMVEMLEDRVVPSQGATPGAHAIVGGGGAPSGGPGQPAGFSPSQISTAYGFNQITFSNGTVAGNGSGQTIAIVDAYNDPTISSDLATFDAMYGLQAPPSFSIVNESGGTTLPTTTASASWALEISLDVEWAHAMAPGANIVLVETNSNSWSDLMAGVSYAAGAPGVSVVSMSWDGTEWSGELSQYNSYFTTPTGHNGVTFVASTGDTGSSGGAQWPAVAPGVLAVGGTQLTTDTTGNYQSETAWSGSSGGLSAYESQPTYQAGVVTQSSTQRAVPDVAYNGSSSSPYAVYDTTGYGGWIQVYGTSAGAPQWAALVAIADQGRALAGQGTLDGLTQTLPTLYSLPATDFHDITTGSNGAYSATTGYDLVTGRGTPYANLVVQGLVGSTTSSGPTVTSPASAGSSAVTGTSTTLTVGATDSASSSLTYTWSATTVPTGATTPTFSVNGTAAASSTTVTFYQAGTYTFKVTITDAFGMTNTSTVNVTVNQTLSSISITPSPAYVGDGTSQQLTASALDQFGKAMTTQPAFTWSLVSGSGTLSSSGLYTAPASGTGSATVKASASGVTGSDTVNYGTAPAAPTNLNATSVQANSVALSWTNNATNQTGFVIQRSSNGGASWTTVGTVGANATSFIDGTVNKHKTYIYRVYAINNYGNSGYSNLLTVTTPNH
jgi:subtilase family serine protease